MANTSDAHDPPFNQPPTTADLRDALSEGDPRKVRALIEAGANIHYKDEHGYDALLAAVYGNIGRDQRLLELLDLLIAERVNLSGETTYQETGLRVLSRAGRFDAVRKLLEAGANKDQLEWTPLMQAVALGSIDSVQAALAQGAELEATDWWSRTAWLLALLVGDIAKAKFLLDRGANANARGRCGSPPLSYAIGGRHPDVLRWLLASGADIRQTDDFGTTALMEAVEDDDLECADILLEAGADVDIDSNGTALNRAESKAMILRLLDAGADPAQLSQEGKRAILDLKPLDALDAISLDDIRSASQRVFGKANPERMHVPLWEAMIRSGETAYKPRRLLEEEFGAVNEPVWCAYRYGQSLTLLPDGRAIQIGGEHEDFYDPDFCIYNDVFVHGHDGSVAIYGYPESVFPPTDFHTATLVGDFIYVIGSLGYADARRYGQTPVYRLNIHTLRMEALALRGESPGWIFKHRAAAENSTSIKVWGGTILSSANSDDLNNLRSFLLDLDHLLWRRMPLIPDP